MLATQVRDRPTSQRPVGVVFLPSSSRTAGMGHRDLTGLELARRIAALREVEFAGCYDGSRMPSGKLYFVPAYALVGRNQARKLGIETEHDLFGGVVPYDFVASKAITHSLIAGDREAPRGWSHDFPHEVREIVLFGFTAFCRNDARQAGLLALERGPIRLKPGAGDGGRGQVVVARSSQLDAAIETVDPADLERCGVVIEENLLDVSTRSIGRVVIGDLSVAYCGKQHLTHDNEGRPAYGGSTLFVVRGGFGELLRVELPCQAQEAVRYADRYDLAADRCFPELIGSRRNYDVLQGRNHAGQWRSGVLEQSWRLGGASGAEIIALEALKANPALTGVCAACVEVYGSAAEIPDDAVVYFQGDDPCVGPLTKYARIERQCDVF